MFGDLLGNLEEKQKAMKEKLATIIVEAEAGDGAVKVKANANKELLNLSINKEALDWEDVEQVEDLIMVAVNRVMEEAIKMEQEAAQNLVKDMMPPGLGNLGNMFGK